MAKSEHIAAVARAARVQHGVLSRQQLLDLGLSRSEIYRGVKSGWLVRIFPEVFSPSGFPTSSARLLMAGALYLGPDAVVSHRAACQLHALGDVKCGFAEFTVPVRKKIQTAVLVQHERVLKQKLVTTREGFRVTSIAATIVDMARFLDIDQLADLVDEAFRTRGATTKSISLAIEKMGGRMAGIENLREVLSERQNSSYHESKLERKTYRVIKAAGLPLPQRQVWVTTEDVRRRLDLAYPGAMVDIECDGYRYHSGARAHRGDAHRSNQLTLLGWRILRVTWNDLKEPSQWLNQLAQLLSEDHGLARPN